MLTLHIRIIFMFYIACVIYGIIYNILDKNNEIYFFIVVQGK